MPATCASLLIALRGFSAAFSQPGTYFGYVCIFLAVVTRLVVGTEQFVAGKDSVCELVSVCQTVATTPQAIVAQLFVQLRYFRHCFSVSAPSLYSSPNCTCSISEGTCRWTFCIV